MKSFAVVPDLDVFEECRSGFPSSLESVMENYLRLERGEEGFRRCAVPAVAFSAHAAADRPAAQLGLGVSASVLAATIAVKQEYGGRPTGLQRPRKGRQNERTVRRSLSPTTRPPDARRDRSRRLGIANLLSSRVEFPSIMINEPVP